MPRRALLLLAGAATAVAAAVGLRGQAGRAGRADSTGGRERTEQLRREIEAARARLRESIRSRDG